MAPLWQDDEEPQWGVDTPEEVKPAEPAAGEAGKPAEGAPAAGAPAEGEAPADPDEIDLKKYNKHWVRPKFLQYSYLYDYRKNYYDDVIDYLNLRSRGQDREIPRPQTWAERVLRTYNQKLGKSETATKTKTDQALMYNIHHWNALHHEHAKSYYHKVFRLAY